MSKRLLFMLFIFNLHFSVAMDQIFLKKPIDPKVEHINVKDHLRPSREIVSSIGIDGISSSPMEDVDQDLGEKIIRDSPVKLKELIDLLHDFGEEGVEKPKSMILFVGDSGCGKSTLARYIPQKFGWNCLFVKGGSIGNEYKDSGPQNVERLFAKARSSKLPCVIIIDEFAAVTNRFGNSNDSDARIVETVWQNLDLCKGNNKVLFIGTLNSLDKFPDPMKKRFSRSTYTFSSPSFFQRKNIINFYLGSHNGLYSPSLLLLTFCWQGKPPRDIEEAIKTVRVKAASRYRLASKESLNKDFVITFNDIRKEGLEIEWPRCEKIKSTLYENPGTVGFLGAATLTLGICLLQNKFSWALHKAQVEVQNNLYGRQLDDTRHNAAMSAIGNLGGSIGNAIVEILREDSKMGDAIKELSDGGKKLLHLDDPRVVAVFNNVANIIKTIDDASPVLKYGILLCFFCPGIIIL